MPIFNNANQAQAAQYKFDGWVKDAKKHNYITSDNADHLKNAFKKVINDNSSSSTAIAAFEKKIDKIKQHLSTPDKTAALANKIAKKILRAQLFTAEVKDSGALKHLTSILTGWEKLAEKREKKANVKKLSSDKRELASDSHNAIRDLIKRIKGHNGKAFIAYDSNNKVQAVAVTTSIAYKKYVEVEVLAAHPNNVPILDNDEPVRGGGSALMHHIATRAKSKHAKGLHLIVSKTAIPFYKKLGFHGFHKEGAGFDLGTTMKEKGMGELAHKNLGIVKDKAPSKFY